MYPIPDAMPSRCKDPLTGNTPGRPARLPGPTAPAEVCPRKAFVGLALGSDVEFASFRANDDTLVAFFPVGDETCDENKYLQMAELPMSSKVSTAVPPAFQFD